MFVDDETLVADEKYFDEKDENHKGLLMKTVEIQVVMVILDLIYKYFGQNI